MQYLYSVTIKGKGKTGTALRYAWGKPRMIEQFVTERRYLSGFDGCSCMHNYVSLIYNVCNRSIVRRIKGDKVMKKIITIVLFQFFIIFLILSSGCKSNSTESSYSDELPADTTHYSPYTRKPNIYIYPVKTCSLSVKIEFPLGGTIIKSIPYYENGWDVSVTPSGRINNEYDYLFYESINPEKYQYSKGWIIRRDSLSIFFSNSLLEAGFNNHEKNDFIEYWIPRLIEYPYYIIYPELLEDIDKVIQLKFSVQPDKVLRLFYVIKGTEYPNLKLYAPIIPKFERSGFVVTEWGVVM